MAHIIILEDGTAYYPPHDGEPGGGREAHPHLPEITNWVELDVDPAKFEKKIRKLLEAAKR